jgi:glycosyltransferase involved in cell wall biosynthesis
MRFVLLTNIVSPHQLPLAYALIDRLGRENFRYIATEGEHSERTKLGWLMGEPPSWIIYPKRSPAEATEAQRWCDEASILLSGLREFDLFRQRACRGHINFYMFERWFKPPIGVLRMLHPGYLRIARECWSLQKQGALIALPIGIHAAKDMMRMSDFLSGDLRRLFRQPKLMMKSKQPLAPFDFTESSDSGRKALQNMRLWGYFVEPTERSETRESHENRASLLRVLWAGRMLNRKRVDTLIKAVVRLLDERMAIRLTIVGYGTEEQKLRQLAGKYLIADAPNPVADNQSGSKSEVSGIQFKEPVLISQVRSLMREADVFVLSSDGSEGWGVTVNEAMAESCCVIGTHEAGSSATMIEHGINGWLYHAGNVTELTDLLGRCDQATIRVRGLQGSKSLEESWLPAHAADRLLGFINQMITPE